MQVRASLARFVGGRRGDDAYARKRTETPGILKAITVWYAEGSVLRVRKAYDSGSGEEQRVALEALAADRLPFEEYVLELTLLGLHGRKHSLEEYAAALGAYIERRVEIAVLSNAEFDLGARGLTNAPVGFGRLVYAAEGTEVRVEVPAGLSPWLHQFTAAHELGHLAAAHPPIPASPLARAREAQDTGTQGRYEPQRRLARKSPLISSLPPEALNGLHEAEADLRAQYAIITCSLGTMTVETSRLSQIG